jgi:hypothetical protein
MTPKSLSIRKWLICTAVVAALMFVGLSAKAAVNFSRESLNYKVTYKWGLVNKQAGHATLTLTPRGNEYICQLTAASEPWADRFYKVRDTLNGVISTVDLTPRIYEKIAHEGGDVKHDVVKFSRNGAKVTGTCTRKEWDKNNEVKKDEKRTLEAYGTTVDMLSSFYYMRGLAYEDWNKGHVVTINIFSGKQKELLTIKYQGTETVDVDGKDYTCYHISFLFTSDGGKKTSDDMDAWIDTRSRIPIKLEGKLKVGAVRCFYTGSN